MKICSHCKVMKSKALFGTNRSQKDGISHRCKDCSKKLAKEWRSKHPERVKLMDRRWKEKNRNLVRKSNLDTKLKSRYGISRDQYLEMVNNQSGRCKICDKTRKLVVDHDHVTGKIRGLLCKSCNIGLGMFNDSAFVIRCAVEYVVNNGK